MFWPLGFKKLYVNLANCRNFFELYKAKQMEKINCMDEILYATVFVKHTIFVWDDSDL